MRFFVNGTMALILAAYISVFSPLNAFGEENKEVSCATLDASVDGDSSSARYVLDMLHGMDCLGGEKDSWDPAYHVKGALEGVPSEPDLEISREKIIGELRIIRDTLLNDTISAEAKQKISDALGQAIENFKKNNLNKIGPHKPKFWAYHPADGKSDVGIDVTTELAVCKEATKTAECAQGYLRAKQLVRYVTVTKRALDYYSMKNVHAHAVYVDMLSKRWDRYFNDARSQFFWELGINGWLYGATNKGKEGLLSPPDYQVIVLHPSVGLEYVDTMAGDRFRETVVLEGLGYNRWTWSDSKMKLPMGISLIGVYGDRSGAPQFGYGGLIHYNNNMSLGVTRRGSETGVILSLDLAKLFLKQSADKQYGFKYRLP